MPKVAKTVNCRIRDWMSQHREQEKYFYISGKKIICKACSKSFDIKTLFQLTQHVNTTLHKQNLNRNNHQQLLTEPQPRNKFHEDLCKAFLAANIPWTKLSNPVFKQFLETYCQRTIPDESTIRKGYLKSIYNDVIETIRSEIGDSPIWLGVDETTDSCQRYMANVMIGKLDKDTSCKPHLLISQELQQTNNTTITQLIHDALHFLWPNKRQSEIETQFVVFLTDGAPYMIKAGNNLKSNYPSLIHVTCVVHGLHRVAETVRSIFRNVDKFVANVKAIFRKCPSRVVKYREMNPGLPLPPEPVTTRWGTWLNAVEFYAKNFDKVKAVVLSFDSCDAVSIKTAQSLLLKEELKEDFVNLSSNFTFVSDVITRLESRSLSLFESISIIENVRNKLGTLPASHSNQKVKEKLDLILAKNPGFETMKNIAAILSGEHPEMEVHLKPNIIASLKYCPLTTVDLERGFSMEKALLSDRRQGFTVENLGMALTCHFEFALE